MRIEVATTRAQSTTKDKGSLLEGIASDLLQTQNYSVVTEVRRTGSELDLVCRHKVNDRKLYVECKAHRDPLSASDLRQLLGTIEFHDYSEGWLIAAGPLGKEAKGFKEEWEQKPPSQRQRLSIYTPDRVINALIDANIVSPPPVPSSTPSLTNNLSPGDWTLLITEHGRFWAQTILLSGAPAAVQVFSAEHGDLVTDPVLLRRLAATDTTLATLDFDLRSSRARLDPYTLDDAQRQSVVQVQHGDRWSDYRPARPEDFVGRKPAQDTILRFLDSVRSGDTTTRVFAITGDSGMGKSSLIAKLRERARNIRYRNKFILYAVDVRAAMTPSYILSAALECFRHTVESGFVQLHDDTLEISDHTEPLGGQSIQRLLDRAREQRRVICLVFDQFEELYSKPEMFPVFEAAQRLFLAAVSAQSNLVLGFAWRSDSTVQQDHPAYFMWHRLRDHRLDVSIGPFGHSEASTALTIFEKELDQKLAPGVRRQIAENSQGYPWLLKKLCIHLYDQLLAGGRHAGLVDTLDVEGLFAEDLKALSQPELNCVKVIASQAPADWHEVLETAGAETLRGLQDKRLIVRSGNRINLYWDLFREYVLTGKAPSVPFTYLPYSSIGAILAVAAELRHENGKSYEELSDLVGRKASTVQNIVHDLVMFQVAQGADSRAVLDGEIATGNDFGVLQRIRDVLSRHALYLMLSATDDEDCEFGIDDVITCLQRTNPTAHHGNTTWKAYAERTLQWLCAAGLLETTKGGWRLNDLGRSQDPATYRGRGKRETSHRKGFQGEAPPERTIACLDWIRDGTHRRAMEVKENGYRNAVSVLLRFGLVQQNPMGLYAPKQANNVETSDNAVWNAAWRNARLKQAREWLAQDPTLAGLELGERLAVVDGERWSQASTQRVGNGIRRWAAWMIEGVGSEPAPAIPPQRRGVRRTDDQQHKLFS